MLTEEAVPTSTRPLGDWALVAGLVAIFAANAIGAVLEPDSYRHILEASPLSRVVGLHQHTWATSVIAINDGLIAAGLLASLIAGRPRRMLAIAGTWLAIAAALKLSACIG